MTRPFPHSKTGVFWVRKVVPSNLRAFVGRRELKESLGTKDIREAKAKGALVIARFEALINSARAGGSQLSQRDIEAIRGEWYRAECEAHGDNPGRPDEWEIYEENLIGRLQQFEDEASEDTVPLEDRIILRSNDRAEATNLLRSHGHVTNDSTVTRLGKALFVAKLDLAKEMQRRIRGDWSPDPMLAKLPPVVAPKPATKAPPVIPKITIAALIAAWGAETMTTGKALYDRERTGKMLSDFLGHSDAAVVTADDVIRWKEARLALGRAIKTVANDIGELRPIWTWGRTNRKLASDQNPFAGLAPRAKRGARRARGPFTEDEARSLLVAARASPKASIRWIPWLACFTGARLGEITQSVKEDIRQDTPGGPWLIHLHNEGVGRTLKTTTGERMVPLHPALIAEGFLRYVQKLPAGSALLPDLTPDKFGMTKGTATKNHGRWVRQTVKITDRRKDPAHAWRHRFEDEARRAGLPQNVTDGLVGHTNPMNESEGYGRGFRYMPDVTAPWVAKMAAPLTVGEDPAD